MKKVSKPETPQKVGKEVIPLTTKEMQETGITATLNQNDVVEVVANELFQRKVEKLDLLMARGKELEEFMETTRKGYAQEIIDKVMKIIPNPDAIQERTEQFSICKKGSSDSYSSSNDRMRIQIMTPYIDDNRKQNRVQRKFRDVSYYKTANLEYEISVHVVIGGKSKDTAKGGLKISETMMTEMTFTQRFKYPSNLYKKLFEEIEAYNDEVLEFMRTELGKDGILDAEALTKQVRLKVNKKLISQQSPVVVDHIKKMFDIDLGDMNKK
jgi:hypothetical protein